jgi:hypothetical protein
MLQVSFSFFNQLGPSMLLSTTLSNANAPGLIVTFQTLGSSWEPLHAWRLVWGSIAMPLYRGCLSIRSNAASGSFSRYTLGRPFAIHEDDIDIAVRFYTMLRQRFVNTDAKPSSPFRSLRATNWTPVSSHPGALCVSLQWLSPNTSYGYGTLPTTSPPKSIANA